MGAFCVWVRQLDRFDISSHNSFTAAFCVWVKATGQPVSMFPNILILRSFPLNCVQTDITTDISIWRVFRFQNISDLLH